MAYSGYAIGNKATVGAGLSAGRSPQQPAPRQPKILAEMETSRLFPPGNVVPMSLRSRSHRGIEFARGTAVITLSVFLAIIPHASAQSRKNTLEKGAAVRPPDQPPIIGQPLETRDPIGKRQRPAFPGQTRAVAVATQTPLRVEIVARGLRNPWSLAFLPGDKILVTEKPGSMRVVGRDGTVGDEIEGVPKVVVGGAAGLLDVALDPSFASTRLIYFSYVEPRARGNGVAIAKARLADNFQKLGSVTTILRVEPSVRGNAHYGCRLLFDKEGKLFVSLAERLFDPYRDQAQFLDSWLGKILRINTDGSAVADNPFTKTPGTLPEIWSFGQRNPQGLAFHPETGELWDTEHGPQGGDEINEINPGKNYGCPVIAYGTDTNLRPINGGQSARDGMEQPIYYWDPAIAPSGATFYSGSLIPEWKNNLFVAALAGEHVARLVFNADRVIGEERLLLDQHQRMRDVRQGPDGAFWVITDHEDGLLIRVSPGNP